MNNEKLHGFDEIFESSNMSNDFNVKMEDSHTKSSENDPDINEICSFSNNEENVLSKLVILKYYRLS